MGKNPDRVLKPRNNLHKKVLAYTQHPDYTPKSLSWFMCYFNTNLEAMRVSLDYLVFKGYLMRLPSGRYAVDKDVRPRITGILYTVQDKNFVLPDAGSAFHQIILIARQYLMGACSGDRVRVALHMWDGVKENGVLFGVVEDIAEPLSDRFCGKVLQNNQALFVQPDRERDDALVQLESGGTLNDVGTYVYAEIINGTVRREEALENASFSQQKKTISGRALGNDWRKAEYFPTEAPKCRVVRTVSPLRSERFLIENRFHGDLPEKALRELETVMKRGNYKRAEFTEQAVCMVNSQLAFHVEKRGAGYRLYVHVPDITEDILPGSALARAMCYKGFMKELVPGKIQKRLSFSVKAKARSFTAELDISRIGQITCVDFYRSRVVCTSRKASALYTKIKKYLPQDCRNDHPVQKAAESALAVYFMKNGKEAPFLKLFLSRKAEVYLPVLQKNGVVSRTEDLFGKLMYGSAAGKDALWKTLEEQMFFHKLEADYGGLMCVVPFGNPFDNFAAILTQITMLFYLQRHHNRTEKEQFSAYLRDNLAACSNQATYLWAYKILKRKEVWMQKHPADGETVHKGKVLGFVSGGNRAMLATAVYSDENVIYCRNVPESVGIND